MKNQIFVAFGFVLSLIIPNAIVANAETTETPSTTVDMQGDYVSFDDIVAALEGTMEESEAGRTYHVQEKSFVLNYGKGYSFVNESPEPFLLETSEADSTILNIAYTTPVLFNEELFVPISYVERLLELDYKDGVFEQNGEPLFKGEDFVDVTPPADSETTEDTVDADTEKEETSESDKKDDSTPTSPVQKPGNNNSNSNSNNNSNSSSNSSNNNTNNNSGNSSSTETLTVKNIYVNQSSLKLEAGKSAKINAVVDPFNVPDASITWSSANTNVATVDNKGNVTAVAEGTTTLTVTSNMNPSVKAIVTVTVTPPPVIVASSVSVDKTSVNLEVGGSAKVSAWVSPDNTTNKGIHWSSENSSIATVDGNGNIVAKAAGTTRIVATAASNNNAKAYITVTVKEKPAPAQPIYTGISVVNQLLNEGFSKGMIENSVAWSPYGNNMTADWYDVEVAALNGRENVDLQIRVAGFDWDNCFTYANKALVKVIPSGASTIINALKAGQSGTWTFDGRTVKVYFTSSAYINISGKQ